VWVVVVSELFQVNIFWEVTDLLCQINLHSCAFHRTAPLADSFETVKEYYEEDLKINYETVRKFTVTRLAESIGAVGDHFTKQ